MTRRILVTGASGFVGRHMVEAILHRGDQVVALDREVGLDMPAGAETLIMDLQDPATITELPRTWDGVIHLAGDSIPAHFFNIKPVMLNLSITLNLLEHLRDTRVLLVSSCHVYAPSDHRRREDHLIAPRGLYGLSKHLVEQVAPRYQTSLDVRIARPFNHLGPGLRPELMLPALLQRLASCATDDLTPVAMKGTNSVRDFIDVRDVVSAYLAILDLDDPVRRTYNVCTGRESSIREVVRTVLKLQGSNREVNFLGSPNSADDVHSLVGDPNQLAMDSGWTARYSLEDSLRSMMLPLFSER